MKNSILLILCGFLLVLTACYADNKSASFHQNKSEKKKKLISEADRTPVLVELFTSEG